MKYHRDAGAWKSPLTPLCKGGKSEGRGWLQKVSMVERIISGGQTGVDRAALDAALEKNFPCGGWCPLGRKAEDGTIPARYPLKETDSPDYEERTERNVAEADGTLALTRGEPTGGTAFTIAIARGYGKPCLVLDLDTTFHCNQVKERNGGRGLHSALESMDVTLPITIQTWLRENNIRVLNVAGPRESTNLGIYKMAKALLEKIVKPQNTD